MVAALRAAAPADCWRLLSDDACGDDHALGRIPSIAPFAACIEFFLDNSSGPVAGGGVLVPLKARFAAADTQSEGGEECGF
jgi:hypothetical protein